MIQRLRFAWSFTVICSLLVPMALMTLPIVGHAQLLASVLPSSRSVQIGETATAFVSMINTGDEAVTNCRVAPGPEFTGQFLYQTTDPTTNALVGEPDTPVDIPPGGIQSFLFALTPDNATTAPALSMIFDCIDTDPVLPVPGLNTLAFSADSQQPADIIASAATLNNDGIVTLQNAQDSSFFVVATSNIGTSGDITARVSTNEAGLPLSTSICQTDPATSACLQPPAQSVTVNIQTGETPTFAIFATGQGIDIPFAPQSRRLFAEFFDNEGSLRGATSVAVRSLPSGNITGTALIGRLLDTNMATTGQDVPIVGATVSILDSGVSAQSDELGWFVLNNIPEQSSYVFDIDTFTAQPGPGGVSYAGFREGLALVENTTNFIERSFFLPRIDTTSVTKVDPSTTTTVENPGLGVVLEVPPNTAKGPTGSNFTGELSISEVPNQLAPAPMPETMSPGLLITIQPVGVTFATPVPISFPNSDGLAPGSETDIWSVNPDTGVFHIVGVGRVSDDGSTIETVSGGIIAADWHFTLPPVPATEIGFNNFNEDCNQCCTVPTGSDTDIRSGNLSVVHELVPYRSLDQRRGIRLVYNSLRAAPDLIVAANTTIPVRSAVPEFITTSLQVAGIPQGGDLYTSTDGLSESVDETLRLARQFDASNLDTGLYPYRLDITNHFGNSAVSGRQIDDLIVVNERDSNVGAGWRIASVQRLHKRPDTSAVLITEGDGSAKAFTPAPIDLNTWSQEGPLSNGSWVVSEDGTSVVQTRNGDPTFFVSPDNIIDATIEGSITVETFGDDDLIGFVLGYRSPLSANADDAEDYEFILFDWKEISQWSTYLSEEGFALSRVNGVITNPLPGFWGRTNSTGFQVLGTDYGDDRGWLPLTEHRFRAIYESNRVRIFIDNELIFDIPGSFEPGRFGFYNYSQNAVRYQGFTSTTRFTSPAGDYSTLIRNPDETFRREMSDGTVIQFNQHGLQTRSTDRNGNEVVFAYNDDDQLTSITDAAGLTTFLSYLNGRLSSVTDPAGRQTTFNHDADGNLISITDPDGSQRQFSYDPEHRMLAQTAKSGAVTQYVYDPRGRNLGANLPLGIERRVAPAELIGLPMPGDGDRANPLPVIRPQDLIGTVTDGNGNTTTIATALFGGANATTDPLGRVTTATRNPNGQADSTTTPSGVITRYTYDELGNITSVTTAEGQSESQNFNYEYDGVFGQISRAIDPLGAQLTFTYDNNGNLIEQVNEVGGIQQVAYGTFGLATSVTNEAGNVTAFSYDARGNLEELQTADGNLIRYERDSAGNVLSETRAFGTALASTFSYTYDEHNRLTSMTDPTGVTREFAYDVSGNLLQNSIVGGTSESYAYDALNRLILLDDPVRGERQIAYDDADNITRVTGQEGFVLTFEYDSANQVIRRTSPLDGEQLLEYNLDGKLTQFTDANGNSIQISYDALGREVQRSNTLGATSSYTYDLASRIATVTDPLGQVITNTYDDLGRRTGSVGPGLNLAFTYDATGRINSASNDVSSLTFTYDAVGQLTSSTTSDSDPQGPTQMTNVWNALNQRSELQRNTDIITYSYDAAGRLLSITSPQGDNITRSFDSVGRVVSSALPSGVTTTIDYDPNGLIDQIDIFQNAQEIEEFTYTYNALGNVVQSSKSSTARNFVYDNQQQLIQASGSDNESYSYDLEGNRTISHRSNSHTVDSAHQLLADDTYTYTYDAKGNLTSRSQGAATDTYSWDIQNQLTGINTAAGETISYLYDPLGRRIEKNVDGQITRYVYDGDNIVQILDSANTVLLQVTHGTDIDEPLILQSPTDSYYLHADHLGSIHRVTDTTGATVNSYDYDSFGNIAINSEGISNPFTFTGREYDAESGLYHYRARSYDPNTGRFLSKDPLQLLEGANPYRYVRNNPLNLTDPTGLFVLGGGVEFNASALLGYGAALDLVVDLNGNIGLRRTTTLLGGATLGGSLTVGLTGSTASNIRDLATPQGYPDLGINIAASKCLGGSLTLARSADENHNSIRNGFATSYGGDFRVGVGLEGSFAAAQSRVTVLRLGNVTSWRGIRRLISNSLGDPAGVLNFVFAPDTSIREVRRAVR